MSQQRRGLALVVSIVILGMLGTLMAFLTMQTATQRKVLHDRERRVQAQWLLRSGQDRALARLQDKAADFEAEWTDLVPQSRIRVRVQGEAKDRIRLEIEASCGLDLPHPTNVAQKSWFRRVETGGAVRFEPLESPLGKGNR